MSALFQANKSRFQILSMGIPPFPSVARINIVIALRVVKLLDVGRDDPVSRHCFPVIDGWLGYLKPKLDSAGTFSIRYCGKPSPTVFETKFMTTPLPWVNSDTG